MEFLSFQCSYVIDIDVHVPWAPDIEVRLPLVVKPSVDEVVSEVISLLLIAVLINYFCSGKHGSLQIG